MSGGVSGWEVPPTERDGDRETESDRERAHAGTHTQSTHKADAKQAQSSHTLWYRTKHIYIYILWVLVLFFFFFRAPLASDTSDRVDRSIDRPILRLSSRQSLSSSPATINQAETFDAIQIQIRTKSSAHSSSLCLTPSIPPRIMNYPNGLF